MGNAGFISSTVGFRKGALSGMSLREFAGIFEEMRDLDRLQTPPWSPEPSVSSCTVTRKTPCLLEFRAL